MSTIDSGPPGIETTHTWNAYPGGPSVMLNLKSDPWIRVTKITGLHSLPDVQDLRQQHAARRGEVVLPSYPRGKTLVYEGKVLALTLDSLRQTSTFMRKAFAERNVEGYMNLGGDVAWSYGARVMELEQDDEQLTGENSVWPYQRPFTLGLRMSDARFYISSPSGVSAASGVAATATNLGNTDTDPTITVNGVPALGTVTMTNSTLGKSLQFANLPAGTLTVGFKKRTATVGGVDVTGLMVEASSSWWDEGVPGLRSGGNSIQVSGGSWTVAWNHASE